MRVIPPASRLVLHGDVAGWASAEAEVDDDVLAPFAALTAVAFSAMDRQVVQMVRDDGVSCPYGPRILGATRNAFNERLPASQRDRRSACLRGVMISLPLLHTRLAHVMGGAPHVSAHHPVATAPCQQSAARHDDVSVHCHEVLSPCNALHQRANDVHQRYDDPFQCSNDVNLQCHELHQHSDELHQRPDDLPRRLDHLQRCARRDCMLLR